MNMEFHAKDYSSAAQLLSDAKERKERIRVAGQYPVKIKELSAALKKSSHDNERLRAKNMMLEDQLQAANRIISRLSASLEEQASKVMASRRHPFQIAQDYLAKHHPGVKLADIISDTRKVRVVAARHGVFRAVKDERDDMSIAAIARRFKRDHSTLLVSLRKTEPKGEDA